MTTGSKKIFLKLFISIQYSFLIKRKIGDIMGKKFELDKSKALKTQSLLSETRQGCFLLLSFFIVLEVLISIAK